jgi:hypothetical protein
MAQSQAQHTLRGNKQTRTSSGLTLAVCHRLVERPSFVYYAPSLLYALA